ncbi:class I SAM-dependent rRNA methyltransferase [Chlamydia suis]|uniref:Class I SAM-dependent rRNA methyltransferase n=2 Tax=Chlamydia suis TaxID=83559 RepID=A0AAQ0EQR4_9CHLA|nr:class I SAM-dependent methyltransferase [Chlamydia suis]MCI5641655.1 class I SAM-dependent methyltransferase [Chlamydia suis]MEB2681220.1 class I SAM-dependent methyltransferase [Chlamydia suis]MEB2681910.1 class I SAM-dependent methyltransferase [Chlamydia suis]MEB2682832.1 class I SAM-dependent methyltransferase [Chlamydia suis]MEB2683927.1 class I SAM-dependent methyltransferase [Chlamydia suis]
MMDYELLDSGDGKKLERFQDVLLIRPAATAIWPKTLPSLWKQHSAEFIRVGEKGEWKSRNHNLKEWWITIDSVRCLLKLTPFGHVGIFPEHATFWRDLRSSLSKSSCKVLNLFAYTGASSIFCAQQGAIVYHVDASKAAVKWAQKNVEGNSFSEKRIFWIIEDVFSFLKKEIRRGKTYDIILLDPPTYGRGPDGETFKIERDFFFLLELCSQLLSSSFSHMLITSHTPGHTPEFLHYLARRALPMLPLQGWRVGESFCGEGDQRLPSGVFAQWNL